MRLRVPALVVGSLLLASHLSAAEPALQVVQYGPEGEIATLTEANEIRVTFSEPMVTLGRIPSPVKAPFFHTSPAISGTFRWSGTKTLIFTPDPRKPLPFATKFTVTVDEAAVSINAQRLIKPLSFNFSTPSVKLLSTDWYRKNDRADEAVVIALRFNQPVDPQSTSAHLQLRLLKHEWKAPVIADNVRARMAPADVAAFDAKVAATRAATEAEGPVFAFLATDWNHKRFAPAPDLVVFETRPGVPADSWIQVIVDGELPGKQGAQRRGARQTYTVKTAPAFFVTGFRCTDKCDPEGYNPIDLTATADITEIRKAISVQDVTDPTHETALRQSAAKKKTTDGEEEEGFVEGQAVSLEDAGYAPQPPATTYIASLSSSLHSTDGQLLGYNWSGLVVNWHKSAFTSFGDGHGVWESSGGGLLPFYARNLRNVTQWAAPISPEELMPTIVSLQSASFKTAPAGSGAARKLAPVPDKIQSYGIDMTSSLAQGHGLIWAALKNGDPIPRSKAYEAGETRATVVQVTNLGINVKDSPQNTLVFVTTLDAGVPVPQAAVSIRNKENKVLWSGRTDAQGLALAPPLPLRDPEDYWMFQFIVTAEKDGDFAYVGSDWNEGLQSWDFGINFDLNEAKPLLRGRVFTDRGVYKLGEEIHVKAILRTDTPNGINLLPSDAPLEIVVKDSRDQEVDHRTVRLGAWSSAEWTMRLAPDGALGSYTMTATVAGQRNAVEGSFLVAAYRRPDFRVDTTLTGDSLIAGDRLSSTVTGRYLFGATMAGREVTWTYSKTPFLSAPRTVLERFPEERYLFASCACDPNTLDHGNISSDEAKLDAKGELHLAPDTARGAGYPYQYTLEGDVTDISRQKIAGRASVVVHPAPWYVGLKQPPYFTDSSSGLDTEVVAVAIDGHPVAGIPVQVTLRRVQWVGVRRAEGNGFYTWETERKEVPAGSWDVTSGEKPAPLHIPIAEGGYYLIKASASVEGRTSQTETSFYALGSGYTAWERYDHNRIDLVPERKTYKPGETARIMIQSPWEKATALITTEREGVRSQRQIDLTSTQQTISVPITADDIPNVFVSVVLIKGRTKATIDEDGSDPGKPAFRIGYTELKVDDATKTLSVEVKANHDEFRPANNARVSLMVKDSAGKPVQSEVTLWAVDYGVLSLTNYKTPEITDSVYVEKALQVSNQDSRQRIVSRRVLTPKGATDGGGGGRDAGPGMLRKDFRVLAFWVGSVITNGRGKAQVDLKLPESLTTYRIMAVAADKASRFGSGQSEIRVNKPVVLRPTFPRFMTIGDKAFFGAVINSQLKKPGPAQVTIRSLDPGVLAFTGETTKSETIAAGGSAEVRFQAEARAIGTARVQMTVKLLNETDAFEDTFPVELIVSPEVVAAYGSTKGKAREQVELPANVVPSFGGLHLELASTALVGLGEGARYLIEYPYGCAEQRASTTLALMLATDLGDAFKLPGIAPAELKPTAQKNLTELQRFQCDNGGFSFWAGECGLVSPYLTSYVLHVEQRGRQLGYKVPDGTLEKAYSYLDSELGQKQPENEGWWPAYTAWQAFAVKVLTEGGKNEDSNINRLFKYVDRMPVFGLAYLQDALIAKKETGARPVEISRRIRNAVLPEGGSAHVEELNDPYLLWFWNSNVRSTAIVLDSLVHTGHDETLISPMVRWLLASRKKGRWDNTQENAMALEALVDYYRKYEAEVPDFSAVVALAQQPVQNEAFQGRTMAAKTRDIGMSDLLARGTAGKKLDLTFEKTGAGTLFYVSRLKYASAEPVLQRLDSGFDVERSYAISSKTGDAREGKNFAAGDLVKVTLTFRLTKERRFVAVTDPVPAGLEPVESWFATTAVDLAKENDRQETNSDWEWWKRGGFDHVERHDDRVNLFATRLSEGKHVFTYLLRATTAGSFRTAPARAEEMYEPEVFGRTATDVIEVTP